eukprot:8060148-Pyramimonas_sp.AAC.1
MPLPRMRASLPHPVRVHLRGASPAGAPRRGPGHARRFPLAAETAPPRLQQLDECINEHFGL